jgi:hypothetical protein
MRSKWVVRLHKSVNKINMWVKEIMVPKYIVGSYKGKQNEHGRLNRYWD